MKQKSFIALSVLTVVLLSGSFLSLAAADDNAEPTPPDMSTPPEPTATPDETQPTPSVDNATVSPDDVILYSSQDDIATTGRNPVPQPGAAEGNLIAVQTAPDTTVAIVFISVVILIVAVGALGVYYYHKKDPEP